MKQLPSWLKRVAFSICTFAALQGIEATPISQWSAEGNAQDSVGSNHGTLVNGLGFTEGHAGQAFNFDGSNDYAQFGTSAGNFGTNDFSIAFWIKAPPTLADRYIMGKRSVCNNASAWQMSVNTAGAVGFAVNPDSTFQWVAITGTTAVHDGLFHHVAAIRQETNILIYVDGVLNASAATPYVFPIQNTAAFTMGRIVCTGIDGHPYFRGQLDEVQIYDRALSASEVQALLTPTPTLPTIMNHPASLIVTEGGDAAFSVTASGSNLTYQWFFEGKAIASATDSTLELSNVQTSDAGPYYVAVSNAVGGLYSEPATLTVQEEGTVSAPTAWWKGEGNALDSAGSNHGTLHNGATFTFGKIGQAFHLDGIDDYVSLGSEAGNFGTNDFTIAFWIKAPPTERNRYIMGKRSVCNNDSAWQFSFDTLGHVGVAMNPDQNGNNWVVVTSASRVDDGAFHYVSAVRHGKTLSLYVDGVLQGTVSSATLYPISNNAPLTLGKIVCTGIDGHPFFAGDLDEVRLYDRALSQAEINSNFNEGEVGPPMVALQPADLTLVEGATATFSVSVTGSAPMQFQWYRNNAIIPGATNNSYEIVNVALTDAGSFHVDVTNAVGFVSSESAELVVLETGPLPAGLVGWWPAEGNANDVIGSNHGTLQNGTTFTSGRFGQAFYFDGSNDSVSFGNTAGNFGTNDFTIAYWIQTEPSPVNRYIMGKRSICNNDSAWQFSVSSAGTVGVAINHDTTFKWIVAAGSTPVDDGQYHHVAAVRRNNELLLYIDGKLEAAQLTPFLYTVQNGGEFTAGRIICTGLDGHPHFAGQLDEIQLYHQALTSTQIQELQDGAGVHENSRPPVIVLQPRDQRRNQGNSPTFKVTAVGTHPMSYQWHTNGIPILGATNSTLTVTNLQETAGFSVLVSNPYGTALSETVFIIDAIAAGNYNGLFHEADTIRHHSSGSIRLKLSGRGAFSARMVGGGAVHTFSGRFQNGSFNSVIPRLVGGPLTVQLELNTEHDADYVRGLVSGDTWTAPVLADRRLFSVRNTSQHAGRYTLAINSETQVGGPIGSSFGSVIVTPAGTVRFSGSFSDNSRGSQAAGLSANGQWPLYLSLYRGAGSVLGWLTFTNGTDSSFIGNVSWIKKDAFGPHFSRGFTNIGQLQGSTYLPPTNRTLISVTNAVVMLTGELEMTNNVILRPSEAVLLGRTNYQVLKMNPATGLFKGNAFDPVAGTKIPIRGAVVQEATNAFGFFLTTNYNGAVNLKPQ